MDNLNPMDDELIDDLKTSYYNHNWSGADRYS